MSVSSGLTSTLLTLAAMAITHNVTLTHSLSHTTSTCFETSESLRVVCTLSPVLRQELSPAHVLYGQPSASPLPQLALSAQTGAIDVGAIEVTGHLVHLHQQRQLLFARWWGWSVVI